MSKKISNSDIKVFVVYEGLEDNAEHSVKVSIVPYNEELSYLQHLVGGYIEHVTLPAKLNDRRIDMWVDEDGIAKELTPTMSMVNQAGETIGAIFGKCVFSKYTDDGYTLGLNEEEMKYVIGYLLEMPRASLEYQGRHVADVLVWEC